MVSHPISRGALPMALVFLVLTGCSGKEERIQSHLQKGRNYFAQAETEKALVEIRNVLQMDPKRADAYYLAGQIEESRSSLKGAYADFSKALEVNPNYLDAKAGLARLNLTVGNDTEAQTQIDELIAKDPANIQGIAVAAALRARHGDLDGAIKMASFTPSSGAVPATTATVLAGLYAAKGDYAKAQSIVDNALLTNPKDITLLVVASDISKHQNDPNRVIGYYQRATAAAPKDFRLWQSWSAYDDQIGAPDKAENVIRDAIKAVPDDSNRKLALVAVLAKHHGDEVGAKQLVTFATDRPKDYPVQFALVNYKQRKADVAGERDLLEAIVHNDGKGPSGLAARNQLADLDLATGDVTKARAHVEEILKIDPRDSSALMLRGRLEFADNQLDAAIADFRAAARDKPDSAPILSLLAKAYQTNKQPDLAHDTLSDAAKLFPNRPALALLWIEDLDAQNRDADAITAATDAMRRNPQDLDLVRIKSALEEKTKDIGAAESTLRTAATEHPRDATVQMLLAQFYTRQRKYDQAIAAYDQASQLVPAAIEPRGDALQVLISQHRYADAEKRVDLGIAQSPKTALYYQFQGDVLNAEGNTTGAEAAYRKAIAVEPAAPSAFLNLANFLASQKRLDEVKTTFQDALKANPKNIPIETAEADFLTKTGQIDGAIEVYTGMLADDPTNSIVANNLAYLLSEGKGDPESLQRALTLAKGFDVATDPGFIDTLAWTHYKLGQYADAVSLLKRATIIAPNAPLLQLHYGMALYKNGAVNEGQEHLKLAVKHGGKLPDAAQQMVDKG